MVVDEPVTFIGNSMECGLRYLVGLVGAAVDEHIAIEVTVPNVNWHRDVAESKTPRSRFKGDVLHGRSPRGCRQRRDIISQGRADLRSFQHCDIAGRERSLHPGQRLVGVTLGLSQRRPVEDAHHSRCQDGQALTDPVGTHHPAPRELCLRRRRAAHDRAADEPISEEARARRRVRAAARMPEHGEAIDVEMISQLADIACPAFVRALGVQGALAVSGTIGCDEPHGLAGRGVGVCREGVSTPRRTVERHYRHTIGLSVLDPRELAPVGKLKHLSVRHGRIIAPRASALPGIRTNPRERRDRDTRASVGRPTVLPNSRYPAGLNCVSSGLARSQPPAD